MAELSLSMQEFQLEKMPTVKIWPLLRECTTNKGAFDVRVQDQRVVVSVLDAAPGVIRMEGRWRSPSFSDDFRKTTGSLLLAPFFFDMTGITLPHSVLSTMGRNTHTIGDLLARNLFNAASLSLIHI